ncbi:MAG TPA: hypothetical protein VLV45_01700 [Gemmatimonadales bacterium]|nr:hypothetical protein [Gemmatimonadales bacterium]
MPSIFVDTDNTDFSDKLFKGTKAGALSTKAENKMQAKVEGIIDKTAGFTRNKSDKQPKGYAIRLEVSKIEKADGKTKCTLSGSIVRYPPEVNKKGAVGEIMVSTGMQSKAIADGTSDGAVLDCIESTAEDLITKSIPYMRKDFLNR